MAVPILIIVFGIIVILCIYYIQNKKHNTIILSLKQDIYKYYVSKQFQKIETETMNDLLLDNDSERKKIIHELHENIGNKIVAAKMQFGSLPHPEILNSNPYVQGHLLLDQVVNDTRQLAYGMSDKELSEFNIMKSLKHIKHTLEQEGKIKLGIYFHGLDKTLSHELNLRLFRMIQELITNTLTHAYASQITVQLNRNDQELILTVEDNGIGFDPRQVNFIRGNGIGLKEIERNLNQIAGSVFIDSTPGHGTTITIQIPLAA